MQEFVQQLWDLAAQYQQAGSHSKAESLYQQILQIQPNHAQAWHHLGVMSYLRGDRQTALNQLTQAAILNPDWAQAHYDLGTIWEEVGQFSSAITSYQKALAVQPDLFEALINLGNCLRETGKPEQALIAFQDGLKLNPISVEAHHNIGTAFQALRKLSEAITSYRLALKQDPNFVKSLLALAYSLYLSGEESEARHTFEQVLKLDPDSMKAQFGLCMAQLPILYQTEAEILESRANYDRELLKLGSDLRLNTPERIQKAVAAVGSMQPFYLAYQGLNDRDLQSLYGNLIHRIMTAQYPQWSQPLKRSQSSTEKIRVGFVSSYFCNHSVWKVLTRGWIESLDPDLFDLYGYSTGLIQDSGTELARSLVHHYTEGILSLETLAHRIRTDELEVLIYPEIGMDPMSVKLAALRLAPIQCASWGHSDTTGIPTIDYYLSNTLMEPENAEQNYSEMLVKLPNLGAYYTPLDIAPIETDFARFGVDPEAVHYLCVQALFKYLPHHDDLFPQIAQAVGNCQFLFLQGNSQTKILERFVHRLENAFARYGLDFKHYGVILPYLKDGEYAALNRLADVFLDGISWSGCNTTFEAIAQNVPIVTLPGSHLRSRQTFAILQMMGVTETIAADLADYVRLAIRLGTDPTWRQQIAEQMAAQRGRVFQDPVVAAAFPAFLRQITRSSDNQKVPNKID